MSNEKLQSCIDACYDCATACKQCENACLEETNVKEFVRCIRLASDCSSICLLTANMMDGGSEFTSQIATVCSTICDACAEECEKHSNMEHCNICAKSCRACAEECKAMNVLEVP